MKKIYKNEKVITLVALTITIILMLIIASITIYSGKSVIKEAKLEELKTNMLLIEAKARECVEDANFKIGLSQDDETKIESVRAEVYGNANLKLSTQTTVNIPNEISSDVTTNEILYWVTPETMKAWGLNKIELEDGEAYFIKFNEKNVSVEVYNNLGYEGSYSLTKINQIEIE